MKIAIMQPYFLPYIGYWQILSYVDRFIIFDDVNYIKKGYINRNKILLKSGLYEFTLPIKEVSQNKKIIDLKLASKNEKILKTILEGYRNSLNYKLVSSTTEQIFNYKSICLVDFIENSIIKLCELLSINTTISRSSLIEINSKGIDKIIPLCKLNNSKIFVNSIGGINLYNKEFFLNEGIELKFLRSDPIQYKQMQKEFKPNLSILDLLFNVPKDLWGEHLRSYTIL